MPLNEITDKCKKAFEDVRHLTTHLSHPNKSELETAELNAKEWFTHGWNAAGQTTNYPDSLIELLEADIMEVEDESCRFYNMGLNAANKIMKEFMGDASTRKDEGRGDVHPTSCRAPTSPSNPSLAEGYYLPKGHPDHSFTAQPSDATDGKLLEIKIGTVTVRPDLVDIIKALENYGYKISRSEAPAHQCDATWEDMAMLKQENRILKERQGEISLKVGSINEIRTHKVDAHTGLLVEREVSMVDDSALEIAEKAYNNWCDETEEVAGERYCHEVPLRIAIDAYLRISKPVSVVDAITSLIAKQMKQCNGQEYHRGYCRAIKDAVNIVRTATSKGNC